jgi:hypothetical protein
VVVLARVQLVEIGDAVDAEYHGLTVNDEMLLPILECGLSDPAITLGRVAAVAREQAHALVFPDQHLVAVVPH